MNAETKTLTPLHPANACAPSVRHRAAVMLAIKLSENGIKDEADLLAHIGSALPALAKKSAVGIAKEIARQANS